MSTTGADVDADVDADWDVPAEGVTARCPKCDRPFRREQYRDLHLGQDHDPDTLTDLERAAYEAARDAEEDDLFLFHLKIVGALAILYTVLVLAYMVFGV